MAFEVIMPRLGWNMETGSLAEWRKKDGDHIEAGEILFAVESDKAIQEVEALDSGILRIPPDSPPLGKQVPVGTVLGYLINPGEPAPFEVRMAATTPAPAPAPAQVPAAPVVPVAEQVPTSRRARAEQPTISPRALCVATELGVDWTTLKGSGRTGRIVERDVRAAAAAQPSMYAKGRVTPLARRVAEELGVDVAKLAAQMPGKRIMRADVETVTQTPPPAPISLGAVLPITQVRKMTAERMAASAHTTAPVTLTTEVDATELVRMRNQLKSDEAEVVPSYSDILTNLLAQALIEYPQVNARFEGDTIVQSATVNMGIAVDTERGLLVPVLRDAQAKSLRQVAQESADLIERARNGHISPDELRGGTFTITNLGMYEIDAFTPIINLPECAILGVGRIVPKQVVVDADAERVAIRQMLLLSLTFDHRLVDGAPAARFLQRVKQYVEKPYLWLVGRV